MISSIVLTFFRPLSSFAHMAASNVEDNVEDNVEEINDVGRNVLAAVEFIFRAQDLVSLCTGFWKFISENSSFVIYL